MSVPRHSRCSTPQVPALEWVDFQDPTHPETVAVLGKIEALPEVQRDAFLADISAVLDLAADGLLDLATGERIKPVIRDPDIYELRWRRSGILLRQYHAEPPSKPGHLISLHLHEKAVVNGDKPATKRLQNEQIAVAQLRYRAGELSEWGTR